MTGWLLDQEYDTPRSRLLQPSPQQAVTEEGSAGFSAVLVHVIIVLLPRPVRPLARLHEALADLSAR
ncbi:hypothetical protein CEP80_02090 [Jonesia denitrificans]|nr:hypothetical protein CEP80_02090 [Jonesia denitrificans]